MRFTLIVSLIMAVLAVIFALANPQLMEVNLLFGEASGSTALVLIITFVVGVLVGLLAAIPGRAKRRRKHKDLKKDPSGTSTPPGSSTSSYGDATETQP